MTETYTSPEYEIDLQLAALIKKIVDGTATDDDKARYDVLCVRRADLMRPYAVGRTSRRARSA